MNAKNERGPVVLEEPVFREGKFMQRRWEEMRCYFQRGSDGERAIQDP